jgi:RNA polymerase sigma-70 factor (ECF subfamily)
MISVKKYNQIVKTHSGSIYNFLYKTLKNKYLCQYLTQKCFLKLWEKYLFLKEEVIKSCLFKTAYRLLLNYIRDNKRMDYQAEIEEVLSIQVPHRYKQIDLLEILFAHLSIEEKTLLILRDQEAYSYKEIVKILDLSQDNVKITLNRI